VSRREQALLERVAALPTEPGVYLFRDAGGSVLYVGKAQSLRARVRSYFGSGGDGRHQVHFLVPRIRDIEVVATPSVKEALLLENQLIKKHKPRFNVRLRDDKNYLGLRLDPLRPLHLEPVAARHVERAAAHLPAPDLLRRGVQELPASRPALPRAGARALRGPLRGGNQ
jgi:excinuclease UvrABC nuclease subunit